MVERKKRHLTSVKLRFEAVLCPLFVAVLATFGPMSAVGSESGASGIVKGADGVASTSSSQSAIKVEGKGKAIPFATNTEERIDDRISVLTRLGKFGPQALVRISPMKINPQPDDTYVVRYTESGYPVTARQQKKIDAAHKIADEYLAKMERLIEEGKMEPPPKLKTQAEIWEERNREILEHERKYGRITTKSYVHPGTTPEQSKLLYAPSTFYVRNEAGKYIPVVDAPKEALPKGWLSKEEYEHPERFLPVKGNASDKAGNTENTAAIPKTAPAGHISDVSGSQSVANTDADEVKSEGADVSEATTASFEDGFEGHAERLERSFDESIVEGFPDLSNPSGEYSRENNQRDKGENVSTNEVRRPLGTLLHGIEGVLAFVVSPATAAEAEAEEPEDPSDLGVVPASRIGAAAFEALTTEIKRGEVRIREHMRNARAVSETNGAEVENDGSTGSDCGACRLNPSDFEFAAGAAHAAAAPGGTAAPEFAGSVSEENIEGQDAQTFQEDRESSLGLEETREIDAVEAAMQMSFPGDPAKRRDAFEQQQALGDILDLIGDPNDPASLVSFMRDVVGENPAIREYVPDIDERLGANAPGVGSDADPTGTGTLLFVSRSLGESELLDLFERNAGKEDVTLVFRGVPQGVKFLDGMTDLQRMASKFDPMPNVVIDPTLFRDYGISRVPTVMRIREHAPLLVESGSGPTGRGNLPEMVAKATGLHSDRWVKEQIELGRTGDLGEQGESREISEPDLIEVMKARVSEIDWEKKKDEAAKRAWANLTYETLPTVERSFTRIVDPTILVTKDITDINGNYIRKAGERVNPLDLRPFRSAMVIFNPMVEAELQTVEEAVADLKKHYPNVMLLATDMVKDETGWEAYEKLTDRLDSHVFLLTKDVRERWDIRATPSVVVADNERKYFVVYEMAPDAAPETNGNAPESATDAEARWPWNPLATANIEEGE